MKTLPISEFLRARAFVKTHARPVDRRLFEFYFEDGTAQRIVDALRAYQNPDGGFGHGLEPDFRLKASSPAATTLALQYLDEIGATPDWEIVQRAIHYLLKSYANGWPPVPPDVNFAPHAPWWSYRTRLPEEHWGCPGAEIVGYLHRYARLVPAEFLSRVTRFALFGLETRPTQVSPNDFLCYVRLLDHLPVNLPEYHRFSEKLVQIVAQNRVQWRGARLKIWWNINWPEARMAGAMKNALVTSLDIELNHQQPDGAWHPQWSWESDSVAGQQAFNEWKGLLTVRLLRALQNFGRIEDVAPSRLPRPNLSDWQSENWRPAANG